MTQHNYEDVTVRVQFARCLNCKHEARLRTFRLCSEVIEKGAQKKVFDGIYRCPFCGSKNPEQWTDTVWERRKVCDVIFQGLRQAPASLDGRMCDLPHILECVLASPELRDVCRDFIDGAANGPRETRARER